MKDETKKWDIADAIKSIRHYMCIFGPAYNAGLIDGGKCDTNGKDETGTDAESYRIAVCHYERKVQSGLDTLAAALRDAEAREQKIATELRDAESRWAETFVENQLVAMADIRAILDPEKPERMMLSEVIDAIAKLKDTADSASEMAPEIIKFCDYVERLEQIAGVSGEVDLEHWVREHAALAAGKERAK